MKLLPTLIIISISISSIACVGRCGPDNYIPTGPQDCIKYSNSTTACCYLEMRDAPAHFSMCFNLNLNDVTPIISIGRLSYRVDCDGIPEFSKYFPLENLYRPCGVSDPLSPKDCWVYTTGYGACCMTGNTTTMEPESDPFCYFFPQVKYDKKNFTVKSNNPNEPYYVACKGSWIKFKIDFTFIFVIWLFLLL